MAIIMVYIVITISFFGYLYYTFKFFNQICKKEKILPVYVIPEPIYETTNKEIPIFVKSFTYTIKYPIEVI